MTRRRSQPQYPPHTAASLSSRGRSRVLDDEPGGVGGQQRTTTIGGPGQENNNRGQGPGPQQNRGRDAETTTTRRGDDTMPRTTRTPTAARMDCRWLMTNRGPTTKRTTALHPPLPLQATARRGKAGANGQGRANGGGDREDGDDNAAQHDGPVGPRL